MFKDLSIICFLVLNIDLYDISAPSLTEQDTDFSLDMLFDNEYCLEALSASSLDFFTTHKVYVSGVTFCNGRSKGPLLIKA